MTFAVKRIVIVGGGTAGWITAGVLAADHFQTGENQGISITLIESPDVKTIGVGEGTWPSMRNTIKRIGIPENEFLLRCGASFKQASKFVGWRNGAKDDEYYHPFMQPEGYGASNLHLAWSLDAAKTSSFADAVCAQPSVCEHSLAPKQQGTPDYAGVLNYGYHLDAGKFADLLREHCKAKLGVKHLVDHVSDINQGASGAITSLSTLENGELEGDLFIDCSGFKSLLISKCYDIPFVDLSQRSLNDRAVAIQVPYSGDFKDEHINSATIATARECGWIWDIGLYHRKGTGYVYSSTHCSEDKAETTLRKYIENSNKNVNTDTLSSKHLKIKTGYYSKFWHKNCVAVGMSAGFIEPLEASALALIEMAAIQISEELPDDYESMEIVAKKYNKKMLYRWSKVVDFLKLHYVLSKRRDTDYWREAADPVSASDELKEQLILWRNRSPYYGDFAQKQEVFPSASYQYVLYGMGFRTNNKKNARAIDNFDLAKSHICSNNNKKEKLLRALPSNRKLLNKIHSLK